MGSKKRPKGIVYSTDPEFNYSYDEQQEVPTLPPGQQDLRVHLQRLKGNKMLTVIRGFTGSAEDMQELGSRLKAACGVGGSAKEGEILIQGDQREKVIKILINEGYRAKKSGG